MYAQTRCYLMKNFHLMNFFIFLCFHEHKNSNINHFNHIFKSADFRVLHSTSGGLVLTGYINIWDCMQKPRRSNRSVPKCPLVQYTLRYASMHFRLAENRHNTQHACLANLFCSLKIYYLTPAVLCVC